MKKSISLFAFIVLLEPLHAADWLQQGGPNGNAFVPADTSGKLAVRFPDRKPPLLWKTSLGLGTAPVVVSDGKVYAFGLYKAGTPSGKLADPDSMPDGRLINNFWHRGITERAAKTLANAKNKPAWYHFLDALSRKNPDWPEFVKILKDTKDTDTGKPIPGYICEGITSIREIPGLPDWVSILPTLPAYDDWPPYRGDEWAQCLDAATGRMIWATKLSDVGIAGSQIGWPAASPTLVEGKILFHTSIGHLVCLQQSNGRLLWDVNLWENQMFFPYASASTPLIFNQTAIVSYPTLPEGLALDDVVSGKIPMWKVWHELVVAVAGFDVETGKFKWICKPSNLPPGSGAFMRGYSVQISSLSYAVIEDHPTVLVHQGCGDYGVDPATGTKRWEFSLECKTDDAHPLGFWAPYGSCAPVAWKNYAVAAFSVGHDDWCSQTYCIQITNNTPKLVWSTISSCPTSSSPSRTSWFATESSMASMPMVFGMSNEREKQQGKKERHSKPTVTPPGWAVSNAGRWKREDCSGVRTRFPPLPGPWCRRMAWHAFPAGGRSARRLRRLEIRHRPAQGKQAGTPGDGATKPSLEELKPGRGLRRSCIGGRATLYPASDNLRGEFPLL